MCKRDFIDFGPKRKRLCIDISYYYICGSSTLSMNDLTGELEKQVGKASMCYRTGQSLYKGRVAT